MQAAHIAEALIVYFQKYKFQPDKLGRATLLSEFGGYIHRVEGHAMGGRSVGYKTCDAPLSLEYALQALYDEQIRPAIAQGLSASRRRRCARSSTSKTNKQNRPLRSQRAVDFCVSGSAQYATPQ